LQTHSINNYQNLGKKITPDFLLENETQQAERLIKERLEEKALSYAHSASHNYTIRLLKLAAKVLFLLGDIDKSIGYIQQGLVLSKKISDFSLNLELSLLLLKKYISTQKYELAEEILIESELIVKDNLPKELGKLYSYYLLLYTETENIKMCKELSYKFSRFYEKL